MSNASVEKTPPGVQLAHSSESSKETLGFASTNELSTIDAEKGGVSHVSSNVPYETTNHAPLEQQGDSRGSPGVADAASKGAGRGGTRPGGMPSFPEGGTMAWCAVMGSWLAMFCTFGYANAFGAYQSYYLYQGYPDRSASDISWVGSVQLFLQFSLGAAAGPLYDKGYFRYLVIGGSVVYSICLFMTSLCTQYWQTLLAQGVGVGIGIGVLFLPAVSIVSQYFMRRRALAIGICVTGASAGGIVFPIMLNNLIVTHGFRKAVQYSAALITICLALSCALMHPRLPVRKGAPKPTPKELFSSKPYALVVAGLFLVAWGLFFPLFYLQVFGEAHNLSTTVTTYTLAILNAASVLGRITPNILADHIGSLNLITIMCAGAGVLCFSVLGATTDAALVVVAIIFGFFSGAYVSLMSPSLISLAKGHHEIGIRIGMGFLVTSFAALTGTPITGALLAKYGYVAPVVFAGVAVLAGAGCFASATVLQRRVKGTWKV